MKNSKMLNAYANSEREAAVDSEDPHTLICVLFDELCRSMNIFFTNLDKKNADLELRGKALSKSLNVIYALQTSLNFEAGGEMLRNLFRFMSMRASNCLRVLNLKNRRVLGRLSIRFQKFVMPGG